MKGILILLLMTLFFSILAFCILCYAFCLIHKDTIENRKNWYKRHTYRSDIEEGDDY